MKKRAKSGGYLLVEVLVYISVVLVVLGVGYAALYRCIDNSILLRRGAEDIAQALDAGERWRADVRSGASPIRVESIDSGDVLQLPRTGDEVAYSFTNASVFRRNGSGPWVKVLGNVKASAMIADPRQHTSAWRWELELQPRRRGGVNPSSMRPLFTFLAVPQTGSPK